MSTRRGVGELGGLLGVLFAMVALLGGGRVEAVSASRGETMRVTIVDRHFRTPVEHARLFVLDARDIDSLLPAGHPRRMLAGDTWFEAKARQVTADDLGRAWIDVPASGVWIAARSDVRFGWTSVPRAMAELELAVERPLVLRVLSPGRLPVSSVPVSIRAVEGELAAAPVWSGVTSTSSGTAVLADVHETLSGPASKSRLVACLEVPLLEATGLNVDPGDVPETPLDLVLPATGSVDVICADSGWPADARIELALVAPGSEESERGPRVWYPAPERAGEHARFPRVGLGGDIVVRVRIPGAQLLERRSRGPLVAGESLALSLEAPLRNTSVRVCLRDEHDAPLARRSGGWEWVEAQQFGEFATDAQGCATIDLGVPCTNPGWRTLAFLLRADAQQPLVASVSTTARELVPGANELGSIVLFPEVSLAAGSARLADGSAAAGGVIVAETRASLGANDSPRWLEHPFTSAVVGADGRFELRGPRASSALRLVLLGSGCRADAQGNASAAPRPCTVSAPFDAGAGAIAGAIVLQLAAPAYVRARLTLPSGLRASDVSVEISDAAPDSTALARELLCPQGESGFRSGPLSPGKKSLVVRWRKQTILTRSDIELRAGEDADLGTIEVHRIGYELELRVFDMSGAPVEDGAVYATSAAGELGRWLACESLAHGIARLRLSEVPVDLTFFAPGFQRQKVSGVRDSRSIVLARATQVRVALDPQVALPDRGSSLELDLVHVTRWAGGMVVRRPPANVDDQLREDWFTRQQGLQRGRAFDATRALTFELIEPGTYFASWVLVEPTSDGVRLHALEAAQANIEVGSNAAALNVTLAPTAASLAKALAERR